MMTTAPSDSVPPWAGRDRDNDFWRGQVWPRRWRLVLDPTLLLALLLGAALSARLANGRPLPNGLKITDLALVEVAFATLSFGACVTGAVLALTLAPTERVKEWATTGRGGAQFSHFSDLIFTFLWSGMAQIFLLASALASYAFGEGIEVAPAHPYTSHSIALVAACVIGAYALLQLVVVIYTISQIGVVIISAFNRPPSPAGTVHR